MTRTRDDSLLWAFSVGGQVFRSLVCQRVNLKKVPKSCKRLHVRTFGANYISTQSLQAIQKI
jgi:hypothetical protein